MAMRRFQHLATLSHDFCTSFRPGLYHIFFRVLGTLAAQWYSKKCLKPGFTQNLPLPIAQDGTTVLYDRREGEYSMVDTLLLGDLLST